MLSDERLSDETLGDQLANKSEAFLLTLEQRRGMARELLAARKVVEALRSAEQLTPGTEHAQLAVKLMREISGTTLALAAYDAAMKEQQ